MSLINHPLIKEQWNEELESIHQKAKSVINQALIEKHLNQEKGVLKRSVWHELADNDLLGMMIPNVYGGKGLSILAQLAISDCVEQLEGVAFSLGLHVLNDVTCSWIVNSNNEYAKMTLLPKLRSGEVLLATCYTDADKSSPSQLIQEDKGYRLSAKKAFCVNGDNADMYLVDAKLPNGIPLTLFIPRVSQGVRIEKLHKRIGLKHIDQTTVCFENVYIDPKQVLTKGFLENTLSWNNAITKGRFFVGIDAYHCIKKMLSLYQRHLRDKPVLGKSIEEYGLYQNVEASLSLTLKKLENEIADIVVKTLNNKNVLLETLRFKEYAVTKAIYFGDLCCEIDGGKGYMEDGLFTPLYLDSLGLRFSAGSQVMLRELSSNQYVTQTKAKLTSVQKCKEALSE